jgi:hypothetical protein
MVIANDFTTIRVSKLLKEKLDTLCGKNETYNDLLEKFIDSSYDLRLMEKEILDELKKKKYVEFDDIEW